MCGGMFFAVAPFLISNLKGLCGGNHHHPGFPCEWQGMGKHVSQADTGAEQIGKEREYERVLALAP